MFVRLQTQWIIAGFGGFIGLNYQSAETVLRIYAVEDRAETFESLQVMEAAALEILNAEGRS